ncbi:MAG: hypothetical protein HY902_10330, partial [Deltaproteobacteria bacterium]|nr:hypothetical protein [Deltaproteobacteria bacterium]
MDSNFLTQRGKSQARGAHTVAVVAAWLALLGTLVQCSDAPVAAPSDTAEVASDTAAAVPSEVVGDQSAGVPDTPVADVAPGIPCKANSDCPAATAPCTEARCEATTLTCRIVQVVDKTACDDGESCTVGDQCQSGACIAGKNACGCTIDSDCQTFDDGNACNGVWFCDSSLSPSQCAAKPGSQVVCPPAESACAAAACDPSTGACTTTPQPDGTACDDGKICTSGDSCKAGQCVSGTNTCPCSKNTDCQDDGDLCNGVPYCDKGELPWTCKTNPGTVVNCSAAGDTACAKNTCDPKLGTCALQPTNQGGPCNDGEACTVGDSCDAGLCKAGPNGCGCQSNADCAPLDDGDLCNGTLYCNKTVQPHVCQVNPASVVVCPSVDDTACKKNQCQKTSGVCQMTNVADATACNDSNPCTADEACKAGECVAATNTCPCQKTTDCTAKDDADLCNGTLFCDKSKLPYQCEVNPATVVLCPGGSSDPCARNLCQPKTGECAITPVNEGATCDADNNFCTQGDVCKQGLCSAGPNTCPCSKDADCLPFDDGNACNGTLYCDKVAQKCLVNPNTLVVCNSANDSFCLANQCQPSTGQCSMTPRNQGVACDADSNPCTVGDVCLAG